MSDYHHLWREAETRAQAARIAELEERVHYAEGTADTNINRANAAEARVAELEADLAICKLSNANLAAALAAKQEPDHVDT